MKNLLGTHLLGTLALSMALLFVPIEAAKKKTTVMEKKTVAAKKVAKPTHDQKKKAAKVEKKKVETKKTKKPETSIAPERKPARPSHTLKHKDEVVGKTADGKRVFEGSSKGHYYLDDKSNKIYVKNFVGAKIIGKTKDGREIYEGPRGGHYYYTASGNKEYITRNKEYTPTEKASWFARATTYAHDKLLGK